MRGCAREVVRGGGAQMMQTFVRLERHNAFALFTLATFGWHNAFGFVRFLFRIFWFYESNEDDELLEDEWEDIGEDGFSIWAKSAYDGILA